MGIAYDATSQGSNNTGTLTIAHTCTGLNRALFSHAAKDYSNITSIVYAGVNLTMETTAGSGGEASSLWYRLNPASGTNNLVATYTPTPSLYLTNASYTGVLQSGMPHKETSSQTTGNLTLSVTTTIDGCWCIIGSKDQANGVTAGAGTTLRGTYNISTLGDSNGPVTPAGAKSLTLNCPAGTHTGCMIAFAPAIDATDVQTTPVPSPGPAFTGGGSFAF